MKGALHLLLTLLKTNKIKVDKDELEFQLLSHPAYPSMHSLSGVLSHFNIDNIAVNVPINEETLDLMPPSFLAQVKSKNGEKLVVVESKDNGYAIKDGLDKPQAQTKVLIQVPSKLLTLGQEQEINLSLKLLSFTYLK